MTSEIDRLCDRDHINLLLAIVEAGSFSAAATALGVSQPSISQQVKRLEFLAGRKLFHRNRNGIRLTSDGEAVVMYARAMLALTDELRRHLEQTAGTVKVSIGMSEDFCRTALPAMLGVFMREHPKTEMQIISGSYETVTAAVEGATVDFAVMRRYSRFPDAKPLWTDELVWYGRPDLFPLPVEDPVPLVLPVAPNPARDPPITALRSCGRSWLIRFESPSIAGIEAAMQAGLGFCVGPRSMRLYDVVELDARAGLPELPDVDFVMVESGRAATEAVLAFAELLRHAAKLGFRRSDRI